MGSRSPEVSERSGNVLTGVKTSILRCEEASRRLEQGPHVCGSSSEAAGPACQPGSTSTFDPVATQRGHTRACGRPWPREVSNAGLPITPPLPFTGVLEGAGREPLTETLFHAVMAAPLSKGASACDVCATQRSVAAQINGCFPRRRCRSS